MHIALTPYGQETFEALIALALERNRELVAGLSRAEIAALLAALDRLLATPRSCWRKARRKCSVSPSVRPIHKMPAAEVSPLSQMQGSGRSAQPFINYPPTEHIDMVTLVCYDFVILHS